MKETFEAVKIDGVKHPRHEIEIVCASCRDPVSAEEEETGTCTNCGKPWKERVSTSIWVTSLPKAGAKTWGQ